MHYLLLVLLLQRLAVPIHSRHDRSERERHSFAKRVHVAKKEELLGEDTNRIDQAEYSLQNLVSPERYEANKFFNKPPSKEIGGLRVDTMSPAQVSFIQSSTQWHKYYKPMPSSSYPSTIYPEDPVLFPGVKASKGQETRERDGYNGGISDLESEGVTRQHHMNNEWGTNSYGSYGDTVGGDQRQSDYENTPFTDKSWWNPKTEGKNANGYESLDGKTVAVPEPRNSQDDLLHSESRFVGRSHELLDGGDMGSIRHNSNLLGGEKLGLLNKLESLKENGVIPQEEEEKVFFNGNQNFLTHSGVAKPPLDTPPGPSEGLGAALAEELLQKNKGKFRDEGESTNIIEGIREAASVLGTGQRDIDESSLLSKPLLDEKATQRTTMYHNNDFDSDTGHLVLIRSHQVKENYPGRKYERKFDKAVEQKQLVASRSNRVKTDVAGQRASHKLNSQQAKAAATKKHLSSLKEKPCKRCNKALLMKKLSLTENTHRPLKGGQNIRIGSNVELKAK
ncbi:uncharacterized protein LOC111338397 [Stylophora pistillata]|uniref:uncharacterized protein LOC111338397 n=1 Tax=Stylophora pistillata TaxID=50429 RepID=UPI000C053E5D|nr:uncharacterized protein LOC111338397 [Stylophora pistillata]